MEDKPENKPFIDHKLNEYLGNYYKLGIFPFKPYQNWLYYGQKPNEYFMRREFAFILENDVHLRYRSFVDGLEFEKELCRVQPHKLDLGAVYNYPPKEKLKFADFKPEQREFVLDIDLTDYDDVRKCCQGAKVCAKCWRLIVLAVEILDSTLREDFYFSAVMWVFSGRRGVHCWVGDEKARKMGNAGRGAVAEYLSLIVGGKLEMKWNMKKGGPPKAHPMIERAYRQVMESGLAEQTAVDQGWTENTELILKGCTDEGLREEIKSDLELSTPLLKWKAITRRCDEMEWERAADKGLQVPSKPSDRARQFIRWLVLFHCYPRLDVNVSTGLNHLLKSPFCVHPKTGNIAVPLEVSSIRDFDVTRCPRVDLLVDEFKRADVDKENRKVLAYKHTSLGRYVETFERFAASCTTLRKKA